jgi:hypothetical protein
VTSKRKIETAYAHKGDVFEGELTKDLTFPNQITIPAGSRVIGQLAQVQRGRRLASTLVSKNGRFRRNAFFTVKLDEIITPKQFHIKITGTICPQYHVFKNAGEFKASVVGDGGQILGVDNLSKDESSEATKILKMLAQTAVKQAAGNMISFGAMPILMGVAGALQPSWVSGKSPGEIDTTSRSKGFVLGATGQIPGGNIIRDFILKGDELRIDEDDELMATAKIVTEENEEERLSKKPVEQYESKIPEEHAVWAKPLSPKEIRNDLSIE